MKATYDKEADAMYIRVKKGKVHKTLKVSDMMLVDVDRKGQTLGLELLFISSQMPRRSINQTIRPGIPVAATA